MIQGSCFDEEGPREEMTLTEVVRMNTWLRAHGLSDSDIIDCQNYIATGIGLPVKRPSEA